MNRHEIPSPVVMSGSYIVNGDGIMLILVVGWDSCEGKIDAKLST